MPKYQIQKAIRVDNDGYCSQLPVEAWGPTIECDQMEIVGILTVLNGKRGDTQEFHKRGWRFEIDIVYNAVEWVSPLEAEEALKVAKEIHRKAVLEEEKRREERERKRNEKKERTLAEKRKLLAQLKKELE